MLTKLGCMTVVSRNINFPRELELETINISLEEKSYVDKW